MYFSCTFQFKKLYFSILRLYIFAKTKAMNRTYKIILRKEEEGGYTVFVPSLPGCITYGETVDEAIAMAKEAIELYIEEIKARA